MDAQTQPNYPGVNPNEVATLVVGGLYFSDWETVWVQHRWHDPYNYFRFTCAERDPIPNLWTLLQFRPGQSCTIYLAGRLAFTGKILVRQVAFDANNHGVSLQGKGNAWELTGSVMSEDSNYKGPLIDIVKQVIAPTSVRMAPPVGTIDGTEFKPPVHPNQGETMYSFIERLARDRNVDLANDKDGNLVLVGPHGPRMTAHLTQGDNILSGQIVINGEDAYSEVLARGQRQPDDQTNGPKASEMSSVAIPKGAKPDYRPLMVPIEHPVWTQHEVDLRAMKEKRWVGMRIDADITTYGWLAPTGNLWQVGTEVDVETIMGMLHQPLTIETATFTQDSTGGTRTQLHLIETDRNNVEGGLATGADTGTDAKADTAPAKNPPAATPPDPAPPYLPGATKLPAEE
jgi:prophage tail gpP-like protein